MKLQKITFVFISSLSVLMFVPQITVGAGIAPEKIEVSDQTTNSALLLSETTALFTIDFSFSDDLYNVEVPVAADYGVSYNDRVNTVGYAITDPEGDTPEITHVNGLVLSTEPLHDTRYQLETGSTGDFTLFVLATFAEAVDTDLTLSITKLPYWFDERRTTVHQNQLDELPVATLKVTE